MTIEAQELEIFQSVFFDEGPRYNVVDVKITSFFVTMVALNMSISRMFLCKMPKDPSGHSLSHFS